LRIEGRGAPDLPLDERNLAWRGLLAGLGGAPELACLTLEKRVPAAAGLGGGSSDAAAAWRLGRAWRGLDDRARGADLRELSSIGADVPFFASGLPAAQVGGIGEEVTPLAAVVHDVVLVLPPFGLSTADVFTELRPEEWGSADNDLLAAACRLRPELPELLEAVRRVGGEPRLTGSGSTIYSLADDEERAGALADALRDRGLSVMLTRTRTSATEIEAIHEEEAR
jgi:4-diphosphocytidyl-2-C-methyl-D-erythritol kinase